MKTYICLWRVSYMFLNLCRKTHHKLFIRRDLYINIKLRFLLPCLIQSLACFQSIQVQVETDKSWQCLFYCEPYSAWYLIMFPCGFVMWINSFILLLWLVSVCSNFFLALSWPWGEKTQKMYSLNLMPVWGVSPASSDQWKVNSLHFLFHSAVLIFLQLLLPFFPASCVFQPLGPKWLP